MRQLLATRETGNKLVVLVISDTTVGPKERAVFLAAGFYVRFEYMFSTQILWIFSHISTKNWIYCL